MIPQDIIDHAVKFSTALAVVTGAFAWWRKGSADEDAMHAQAADTILGAVSDADTVARIDMHTGRNLRDQLTVEQAEDLERERNLRRFARRN